MELLINKAILSKYFQIGSGLKESEVNNYIESAQQLDLKQSIPDDFYYHLMKNYKTSGYKLIMFGGEYVDEEITKNLIGFDKVLAHFTYARMLMSSDIVSTTHGFRRKSTQQSESISFLEKQSQSKRIIKEGHIYLKELKDYLTDVDFTDWKCNGSGQDNNIYSPKIRVIN